MSSPHFAGKTVVDHLREARTKGATVSSEIHGVETPGHLAAFCDAAKETAILLFFLWIVLYRTLPTFPFFQIALILSCGWIIWKTGRSAILGWSRVERLHRLIEEERWEIEHHRTQEKEELTEMYRAKGFEGDLLTEVIDVLMADDNRLLRVMLEEELGLTLEVVEHPLKQAWGALFGTALTATLCLFGFWIAPSFGLAIFASLIFLITTAILIKFERNRFTALFTWNIALGILVAGFVYLLIPLFFSVNT